LPGEFPLVLDLQTLEALREPVGMQLSAQHLFMLVATVQLALRHPAFQGSTRDFAEEWALEAAAELARIAPALKPVLLAGFKPEHDVPAGQAEKRIIVPGA
jgi:hypothetical protein